MNNYRSSESGFSLIELIIVMLVMVIISLIAYKSFSSIRHYDADNKAYVVMDMLKEARQRAITQQETLRVELNKSTNTAHLYNENEAGDDSDDVELKAYRLSGDGLVYFDRAPDNSPGNPSTSSPAPIIQYKTSVYSNSSGDQVATLRFLRNGRVTDAGSDSIGSNSVELGATIFFWSPRETSSGLSTTHAKVLRAITVSGASGNPTYWTCGIPEGGSCTEWQK